MEKEITVCLTSCDRWDLLERTIKSLVANWDFAPPKEFFIYEDSPITHELAHDLAERIITWCNWPDTWIDVYYNPKGERIGQIKAIDLLYEMVETPYIFHCEDDFEFYKPGFIERSLDVLETNPKICQVWIREPNDRNGHPAIGPILQTPNRTKFQKLSTTYRNTWHGFSFNPGLRRKADYDLIGPYSQLTNGHKSGLQAEVLVGKAYLRHGFYAATLLNGFCKHIGENRHVK